MSPTWFRALDGSPSNIDATATDYLCYSKLAWHHRHLSRLCSLNDQRTRGSKRLCQLPATNDAYKFSFHPRTIQWLESVTNTHHRPPDRMSLQTHTPDVQLDSQLPVNIFKWGTYVLYLLLSGIAVLYRVKNNLEKISTLDTEGRGGGGGGGATMLGSASFYKSTTPGELGYWHFSKLQATNIGSEIEVEDHFHYLTIIIGLRRLKQIHQKGIFRRMASCIQEYVAISSLTN